MHLYVSLQASGLFACIIWNACNLIQHTSAYVSIRQHTSASVSMHYLERQHQLLELMQLIPLQLPSESELCVCVCVCVCVCKKQSEGEKSRAPAGALPTVMPRAVLSGPPISLAVSAAVRGTLKHILIVCASTSPPIPLAEPAEAHVH
jgi:hypothetical protein